MNTFVKCELCDIEVSSEKCVFAIIEDKEHCFCCKHHAEEFQEAES